MAYQTDQRIFMNGTAESHIQRQLKSYRIRYSNQQIHHVTDVIPLFSGVYDYDSPAAIPIHRASLSLIYKTICLKQVYTTITVVIPWFAPWFVLEWLSVQIYFKVTETIEY